MHKIEIKLKFRSGHRLMPPYIGKCNNPHGEGYTAICFFEGRLDEKGMVIDFGEAKTKIKEWLDNNWDHAYLHKYDDEVGVWLYNNKYKTFSLPYNPTAENMSGFLFNVIFNQLKLKVCKVGIIESFEDSIAWYEKK